MNDNLAAIVAEACEFMRTGANKALERPNFKAHFERKGAGLVRSIVGKGAGLTGDATADLVKLGVTLVIRETEAVTIQ
jgi:hypothetical protein